MLSRVSLLLAAIVAVAEGKPNIVFVLTDDQDTRLGESDEYTDIGSVASQPKVRELFLANGARFTNYFVNTPICCPSRTEFFTGRYFPNVRGEKGAGCMHANTTHAALKDEGLFGAFTTAGYEVGLFGKVTNDQAAQLDLLTEYKSATYIDAPVNYNNYFGLPYYHYYASNGTNYTENIDAKNPIYGTPYQTSQIGNRTMLWLDDIFSHNVGTPEHPFLLYMGPHAPHFPADPAPWYEELWSNLTIPITPNYNVSSPDKTQHIRQNPPLTAQVKCWEDQHFRDRWAALMSVDDLVGAVHAKIASQGDAVLHNTYFFYTSDHGYKQGQWRVGTSKQHPYETDIRIPFLALGPGILPGTIVHEMCGNVDLMPTLLDLADIPAPPTVDGKSFKKLLIANEERDVTAEGWRKKFLNVYESVGTYFNDHSPCWAPAGYEATCGGPMPRSPDGRSNTSDCKEGTGVGDGNCYFVDSEHSNCWRALRVMNATHNTQYIEYDCTWTFNATSIQFHEYYDITADPYQMTNGYPQLSESEKAHMHTELSDYYSCSTTSCP